MNILWGLQLLVNFLHKYGENLLDKIIFIADNVESKTEGLELLEQIKAEQIDGPNECVIRIIEQKKKEIDKKD